MPCEGEIPLLEENDEKNYAAKVPSWQLLTEGMHKIVKQFKFADFKAAMDFVNKVAELAESEGHHPNITIIYNKVRMELYTHVIGGLSENDFIMAAKIDHI